jgi:hypothetical protein
MGEGNKIAIALVFMCLPLGCTAPGQEATEITCVDSDGKIFYTGSYIEERSNGYLVQLDERTEAFFPKGPCHKMPA